MSSKSIYKDQYNETYSLIFIVSSSATRDKMESLVTLILRHYESCARWQRPILPVPSTPWVWMKMSDQFKINHFVEKTGPQFVTGAVCVEQKLGKIEELRRWRLRSHWASLSESCKPNILYPTNVQVVPTNLHSSWYKLLITMVSIKKSFRNCDVHDFLSFLLGFAYFPMIKHFPHFPCWISLGALPEATMAPAKESSSSMPGQNDHLQPNMNSKMAQFKMDDHSKSFPKNMMPGWCLFPIKLRFSPTDPWVMSPPWIIRGLQRHSDPKRESVAGFWNKIWHPKFTSLTLFDQLLYEYIHQGQPTISDMSWYKQLQLQQSQWAYCDNIKQWDQWVTNHEWSFSTAYGEDRNNKHKELGYKNTMELIMNLI